MDVKSLPVEAAQYHRAPWISLEQASEITSIATSVIERHAESGWLPAIRVSGEYRVHRDRLAGYHTQPMNRAGALYDSIVSLERSIRGYIDATALASRHQIPRVEIVHACDRLGYKLSDDRRYR